MMRIALLVDSPSKRAHGNAASRLALGLVESGEAEVDLVCYSEDPAPPWLSPEVRIHRLGVDRVSRSVPALVRYLRTQRPDVLITRQVHANFVGLAASWIARTPPRWPGRLILVQDHLPELTHASNRRDNKWLAKASYRFADGLIAPSPTVLANTIEWCGLDPSTGALVPNPIPKHSGPLAPPPHPWLRDGEPPVFVNVTNLLPFKRVDLLIDAFSRVRAAPRLPAAHPRRGAGPRPGRRTDPTARARRGRGHCGMDRRPAAVRRPLLGPGASLRRGRLRAGPHRGDERRHAPSSPPTRREAGPRFVTDDGTYGLLVPRGDVDGLVEAMATMLDSEVRARYSALGEQRAEDDVAGRQRDGADRLPGATVRVAG